MKEGIALKAVKKRTALLTALMLVLAVITGCGQKSQLRIGTAGEGGNYNSLGHALSETLEKEPYKICDGTSVGFCHRNPSCGMAVLWLK